MRRRLACIWRLVDDHLERRLAVEPVERDQRGELGRDGAERGAEPGPVVEQPLGHGVGVHQAEERLVGHLDHAVRRHRQRLPRGDVRRAVGVALGRDGRSSVVPTAWPRLPRREPRPRRASSSLSGTTERTGARHRLLLDGVEIRRSGCRSAPWRSGGGGLPDRTRCLDDLLDVLDDPLEGHALLQVAVGPDGHGLLGHLGRAEAGEDDDLGLRDQATDRGQRLEAVHHGHRQVEQHDVGLLEADALDAGQAVPGLADHLEPAPREGQAQQLAQVVGVVDDDDAHAAECAGRPRSWGRPLGLGRFDGLGQVGRRAWAARGPADRRRRRERCAAGRARRARSPAGR